MSAETGGTIIRCDCCKTPLRLIESLYDHGLQEFVCANCAIDLRMGEWVLEDAGYTSCAGVRVENMPHRQAYGTTNK